MSTYAIKADKFFLPAGPQLGGYLMVEDGVFGAWQADEPSCEIKDYTGSSRSRTPALPSLRRTRVAAPTSAVLAFRASTWRAPSLP